MKDLKKRRRAAGLTQYALAGATKKQISRARISHFELGIAIPTERETALIEKILDRARRKNAAIWGDNDAERSGKSRLRSEGPSA
jgi:transcriptional regulator with XRE-family HTH domain